MATHGKFVYNVLKKKFNVTLLNEQTKSLNQKEIEKFDLIIRYSRYQKGYFDFSNADFSKHISNNKEKNILFLFADATLFHSKIIKQIKKEYNYIWCDSEFCYQQAIKSGLKADFYISPGFKVAIPKVKHTGYWNFIHIASRELQYVKWTDLILDSFYKAFNKDDSVKLTILTNNKKIDDDAIDLYQKKFNKENRLHQLNIISQKIPNKEVLDLIKKHNIYINSSRLETFWIPVIESALLGLKIISPNEHWMKEYIDKINAITIDGRWKDMPANTRRLNKKSRLFEVYWSSLQNALRESLKVEHDYIHNIKVINELYSYDRQEKKLIWHFYKIIWKNV